MHNDFHIYLYYINNKNNDNTYNFHSYNNFYVYNLHINYNNVYNNDRLLFVRRMH